ncbi:MAG: hypothetical protein L0H35_06055, partial [Psychrobacter sp.]|nr:hypothetical protein [Psychrobacter sp.]
MEKQQVFSCYVIGNDTLTMHCASILVEKNHLVMGVISKSPQIKTWCHEQHIPFIYDINEFEKEHCHTSFDYLFSIVNDVILPESIISAPRCHAINYHNSPLPKYAGLYATSWAILNNESKHAISWHLIEPKIDTGAVVKQSFVPIDQQDTALILNLKCYEAAIESFSILVDELNSGTELLVPQNLEHRSYYGLKNKPNNMGFVAWDSSADEIDRLCRALSLGSYRNELATPKLFINNQWYIINAHRILHVASKGAPGTVVHLSKNEVQITTNTVDIALLSIMNADGVIYDMEHWSTLCALSVGQTLPRINQIEHCLMASMPQIERFWVKEYTTYIHHNLSFLAPLHRTTVPDAGRRSSLVLPQHISHQVQLYSTKMTLPSHYLLLTVVLIYIYRINDYKNYSLQISDLSWMQQSDESSFFLSDTYPLTTNLSHDLSFSETLYQTTNELIRLEQHDTFCNDLFVRYPELQIPQKEVLIRFIDEDEPICASHNEYKLIISISKNGSGLHIHNKTNYKDNEFSYAFFNHIEEYLGLLLEDTLAHPEKKIYELTLLSQEELGLMNSWNNTNHNYDTTQLLHYEIEQQTLKTPKR